MNKFELRREQSKIQIKEAALILFSEIGYEKTSIRMIAQKAGISLGLLYNYYPGKEELLEEIFRKNWLEVHASLTSFTDKNSKYDIESYIRLTLKSVKQNRPIWKLIHGIRMQSPVFGKIEAEIKTETENTQKKIEDYLIQMNIPFPGLEAKLLLATIDGIVNQYLLYDHYPIDDVANLLIIKYKELARQHSSV